MEENRSRELEQLQIPQLPLVRPNPFRHHAGSGMDLAPCAKNLPSGPSKSDFPATPSAALVWANRVHLTREVVESTLQHLPADKPRYLMGVGTPEEIVEYSNLGVDMMDCVLPTRAARHGLLFTSEGRSLSSRRATRPTKGRSIPIATVRSARGIRAPI